MSVLGPKSPAGAAVEPVAPAVGAKQSTTAKVLVTEHEVVFSTAAAASGSLAPTQRSRPGAALTATIRRMLLRKPRRHYPLREPLYMEAARMSREMDRL